MIINLGQPQPKQIEMINARQKYVGYGGARGGGKSWTVRWLAVSYCIKHAGIKVLIIRETYPELENNHIRPLCELLRGFVKYNDSKKIMTFPNGSTIKFGYCHAERDLNQYQGAEYDIIFVDEATQIPEEWLKKITACMRGVNGFPKRTYYTCNPGGVSHGYIKRLFIDRAFRSNEKPEDYTFIHALVTDNKALMESQPDYVDQLKALPPKLRKAWLEGSFDILEGQYFEEFCDDPDHYRDRRWTHVIDPITVRKHWPIYRSFDWGYRRPFSMGYYTIDDDGCMFRICEFYGVKYSDGEVLPNEGVKWAPERVFAKIQQFENEHPLLAGREIHGVADPAIWDAEGGISYAETAMKYGIYFNKGDHKRIPGWMQCHYRLMFDANGIPNFQVFNTCKQFIRTIPLLQYDEHTVEDLDTEGEDHIADEWRYMCMARPITPVLEQEEYEPMLGADPLEQFKRRRRT